jgi:hypothetical protein
MGGSTVGGFASPHLARSPSTGPSRDGTRGGGARGTPSPPSSLGALRRSADKRCRSVCAAVQTLSTRVQRAAASATPPAGGCGGGGGSAAVGRGGGCGGRRIAYVRMSQQQQHDHAHGDGRHDDEPLDHWACADSDAMLAREGDATMAARRGLALEHDAVTSSSSDHAGSSSSSLARQ